MDLDREAIEYIVENTVVLRPPRQTLSTFGITNVHYYVITEPSYSGLVEEGKEETVVREGKVIAEQPRIVTPRYLLGLFQGFEHGAAYAQYLLSTYGPHAPGLLYSYRNEFSELNIVSDPLPAVAGRLKQTLDEGGEHLAAIIKGVDQFWDISLMKFIYELTSQSASHNASEMAQRGLFAQDENGIPLEARQRIDELFGAVKRGHVPPARLKAELDRWGVFAVYEDRFLDLFRRRT